MGRFLAYFAAALVFVVGAAWIWVLRERMSFLDAEYPAWRAKFDMAGNLPGNSVVIIGDSRAATAFIPARIGADVYNLAFGGASPMEQMIITNQLLASPHPPRAIILSSSPFSHMLLTPTFWQRISYRYPGEAPLEEIRSVSRQFADPVYVPDAFYVHREELFGPMTVGDLDARLKTALYSMDFPSLCFSSILNGGLFERRSENQQLYQLALASRGQTFFGTENGSHLLPGEQRYHVPAFIPSPFLDRYFSEMLVVFRSRQIPVYLVDAPIKDETAASLPPRYISDYATYIQSYVPRFSNLHILGDQLPQYSWKYFGDGDHLNELGAEIFSDRVASLLKSAGVEK